MEAQAIYLNLFAQRANGNLLFVRLFAKKKEVIRLYGLHGLAHLCQQQTYRSGSKACAKSLHNTVFTSCILRLVTKTWPTGSLAVLGSSHSAREDQRILIMGGVSAVWQRLTALHSAPPIGSARRGKLSWWPWPRIVAMSMLHVRVQATCLCYMSVTWLHAYPTCPFPCYMPMPMLHVHVSIPYILDVCPRCMSNSPSFLSMQLCPC
jgi:hypothetical protein